MPDLIVWKDKQIKKMKQDMDRMFADFFREFGVPFFAESFGEMPAVEISETEDSVIVTADLPGLEPEDFDISVSDQYLVLKGTRKEKVIKQGSTMHRSGTFTNQLRLPCKIEPGRVEASYSNNQLRIVLPKCRSAGLKKIHIKRTGK